MKSSNDNSQNKHVGNLIGLLENKYEQSPNDTADASDILRRTQQIKQAFELDILVTNPKFALYINDCEVVFASRETSSFGFL